MQDNQITTTNISMYIKTIQGIFIIVLQLKWNVSIITRILDVKNEHFVDCFTTVFHLF